MVSGIGLFFGLAGITTLMNQRLAVGFTFGNLLLGLFGFAFGCLMVRMACEMRVVRKLNAPQHIRNTSATHPQQIRNRLFDQYGLLSA